jgi:hypothetical protein
MIQHNKMEYINVNKAPPVKRFKQLIDNAVYADKKYCHCKPDIFKNASADPNSAFYTRNQRISNIVNNSNYKGGRIQFGNTYLGTFNGDLGLNYLGRLEGMPGGSGAPFKNKF